MIWLMRWLLFRLMFLSGAVKLLSGDPTWRNLTALEYHYWTQPLPTPLAWYAAQLPAWFQRFSVVMVFAVELVVPFLIFAPRRIRHVVAGLIVSLELLIALTGNYAFFNLLTILLCILLLDDSFFRRWLPASLVRRLNTNAKTDRPACISVRFGKRIRVLLAIFIFTVTGAQLFAAFGHTGGVPRFAFRWIDWQSPFYIANTYGLFAVMTTSRTEIVVEGSNDGAVWQPYEFKYKPGDLARRPAWVAPHQPRLDWQMWFAALGNLSRKSLVCEPDDCAHEWHSRGHAFACEKSFCECSAALHSRCSVRLSLHRCSNAQGDRRVVDSQAKRTVLPRSLSERSLIVIANLFQPAFEQLRVNPAARLCSIRCI